MKKGSKIAIQATARTETWTDKSTGSKRSTLKFRVNNFTFLGVKTGEARPGKPVAAGVAADDEDTGFSGNDGEEIPF